jgi:hypothetical protein
MVDPLHRFTRAIHEAGHAAIGIHFGARLELITLESDDQSEAHCDWDWGEFSIADWQDPRAFACALCHLGGLAATEVGWGEVCTPELFVVNYETRAASRFLPPGASKDQDYQRQVNACAIALARKHWSGVKRLADLLMKRNSIDGREASEIVRGPCCRQVYDFGDLPPAPAWEQGSHG